MFTNFTQIITKRWRQIQILSDVWKICLFTYSILRIISLYKIHLLHPSWKLHNFTNLICFHFWFRNGNEWWKMSSKLFFILFWIIWSLLHDGVFSSPHFMKTFYKTWYVMKNSQHWRESCHATYGTLVCLIIVPSLKRIW